MLSNNKLYLCSDESVTNDPNYRYKVDVPMFELKKKKGVNITCFTNSKSFALSIETNELLLLKLIGSELSCQSYIDKDIKCGVFKGQFEDDVVNSIICNIVKHYLLCQTCDKPEVKLYNKNNNLRQKCRACGSKHYVKSNLKVTKMYELISKHI